MKSKLPLSFIALLLVLGTFHACGGTGFRNQIEFGINAADKNLWDEAIFRWKKVLEERPDSAAARNNLAVAYENRGLWEEAEEEYKKALKISPENKYIKYNYENFLKRKENEKDEKEKESNSDL